MMSNNKTDTIQFYYNPMSRARIVHWMLEEVGAPYEITLLDWSKDGIKSPEFLKINPMGKIPTIIHKNIVVTEGAAICAYLADAFPQAHLAPSVTDPSRGAYYRWLFFTASNLEPAMLSKTAAPNPALTSRMLGYGSYEDVVSTMEQALTNKFLVNDTFSAADLYLSSNIAWYLMQKSLEPKLAFVDYVKRCEKRVAFKRFTEKAGKLG